MVDQAMRRAAPRQASSERVPDDGAAVLDVLEPDQLVTAKGRRFGRRKLGPGETMLMWALRGYLLFMVVVVADRVIQVASGGS